MKCSERFRAGGPDADKMEVNNMICPGCECENEMAYSVLSHGLVCLEPGCGFEMEVDALDAQQVLETEEELVCC